MIFIEKSTTNPNISVYKEKRWKGANGKKTTLAKRDYEKAIAHYANPANFKNNKKITKKSFTYEAYSHKDTKKVLKKVFNSKCAYCESFIMHIEPGDVEHFRPKAEIHTADGGVLIPGYYWLGADWKNLLLSCIKCNRSNNEAINVSDGVVQNMGKANHFPLSDETKRVRIHNQNIATEDPFVNIINPCVEDPNNHLIFEDNGEVKPIDDKGEQSIKVYGLYRADLVLKRSLASTDLDLTLTGLIQTVQILEQFASNGLPIENALLMLETHRTKLIYAFQKNAEFLGLKRQKLQRFIDDNTQSVHRLNTLGIHLEDFLP
ncbi:hypothetical protein [uncultured Dokdonia sp.]|uniref:hypothetical protein n=1 Tax=uncultured Dokdonia sp. TaxID=575653 RepID=UPI002609916B|nr:hypothetical protein [uncultured Dokdonia sp.]